MPRMFRYQKRADELLDGVSRREVQARAKAAEKAAVQAVLRAAKAASVAGLPYCPPEGVSVQLRESDPKGRDTVEAVEARLARLRVELAEAEEQVAAATARSRRLQEQRQGEAATATAALAAARKAAQAAKRDVEAAAEKLRQYEGPTRRHSSSSLAVAAASEEASRSWDHRRHPVEASDGADDDADEGSADTDRGPPRMQRTPSISSRMHRQASHDGSSGATGSKPLRPLAAFQAAKQPPPGSAKPPASSDKAPGSAKPAAHPKAPATSRPPATAKQAPGASTKPAAATAAKAAGAASTKAPKGRPQHPPLSPEAPGGGRPPAVQAGTPNQQPAASGSAVAGARSTGARAPRGPAKKLLTMADLSSALQGRVLQLYWPDDGSWWVGQVLSVDAVRGTAHVLYNTGEEEAALDLQDLIERGEVAWAAPNTHLSPAAVAASAAAAAAAAAASGEQAGAAGGAVAGPEQQKQGQLAGAGAGAGTPNKRKAGLPPSAAASSAAAAAPAPKRPRTAGPADVPPQPPGSKAGSKPAAPKQRPPQAAAGAAPGSPAKPAKAGGAGRAEVISLDRLLRMGRDAIGREVEVFSEDERVWQRAQVAHVTGRQSVDLLYVAGPLPDGTLHAAEDGDVMLRLLPR